MWSRWLARCAHPPGRVRCATTGEHRATQCRPQAGAHGRDYTMQANQVWQAVLSDLRGTLPPRDFESMLQTSSIVAFEAEQAVVAMPNAYAAEWSETRLTSQVERLMSKIV